MRYEIRPETKLGPGPYSVYVNGKHLITVDTKAEAEQVKTEHAESQGKPSSGRR